MIRGETSISDLSRNSQAAEGFHRAGRDVIALHAAHLIGGVALGNHNIDAARSQIQREGGSDRATADNQN
jgi:hypothetical protein